MCHLYILHFTCSCNLQHLQSCTRSRSPPHRKTVGYLRICPFFTVINLLASSSVYPCPRGHGATDKVNFTLLHNLVYDVSGAQRGRIGEFEDVELIPGEGFVRRTKEEGWDDKWWVDARETRAGFMNGETEEEAMMVDSGGALWG